jgi:hypothetical protein
LAGWGLTGFLDGKLADTLHKTVLPILPLDVCAEYFPFVSGRQFCLVQSKPGSIVGRPRGDAGGPVLCARSPGEQKIHNEYVKRVGQQQLRRQVVQQQAASSNSSSSAASTEDNKQEVEYSR